MAKTPEEHQLDELIQTFISVLRTRLPSSRVDYAITILDMVTEFEEKDMPEVLEYAVKGIALISPDLSIKHVELGGLSIWMIYRQSTLNCHLSNRGVTDLDDLDDLGHFTDSR